MITFPGGSGAVHRPGQASLQASRFALHWVWQVPTELPSSFKHSARHSSNHVWHWSLPQPVKGSQRAGPREELQARDKLRTKPSRSQARTRRKLAGPHGGGKGDLRGRVGPGRSVRGASERDVGGSVGSNLR